MRGVTSSSVAISDWRQLPNSNAAARRLWTVVGNVHMVARSSHTDSHTNAQFVFKIPWNSLNSSRLRRALFSHSHLPAGWGGVNVSLTWFLYSQWSLHAVSRLLARRGILSGLKTACCHLLIVLFDGSALSSNQWPFSTSHFGSVERRERSRFFKSDPRTCLKEQMKHKLE